MSVVVNVMLSLMSPLLALCNLSTHGGEVMYFGVFDLRVNLVS